MNYTPGYRQPVRSVDDVIDVVRDERRRLKLSGEAVDAIAGLPERYTAKLENWRTSWGRGAGAMSLPSVVHALGLELWSIENGRPVRFIGDPTKYRAAYSKQFADPEARVFICRRAG